MGHLSCRSPASFNKKIKVTCFKEISKSWEKALPWSHSGLFLGLIHIASIEANGYRGRILSFSSSLFLIQASAGTVMWIHTISRTHHHLPSRCPSTTSRSSSHTEDPCDLRQVAYLSKPQFAHLKMGSKKYLSYRISVPATWSMHR